MKQFPLFALLLAVTLVMPAAMLAQDAQPTISPAAHFVMSDGQEEDGGATDVSGSAPIRAHFSANPSNHEGWDATYEWRVRREKDKEPHIIRYDEETDITFNESGTSKIVCFATFTQNGDSVVYAAEAWGDDGMFVPFAVTIATSHLEMPNAFSPNGDDYNNTYKPKTCRSIVEFRAIIFNRMGQKLYEWTNPDGEGWDGTYKGHDVPDGVYYCLVNARGADGVVYKIRRDVNLLRSFTESTEVKP